jgi:hypothetical protein
VFVLRCDSKAVGFALLGEKRRAGGGLYWEVLEPHVEDEFKDQGWEELLLEQRLHHIKQRTKACNKESAIVHIKEGDSERMIEI